MAPRDQQQTDADVSHGTTTTTILRKTGASAPREDSTPSTDPDYKMEIVWGNVVKFAILHAFALAGIVLLPRTSWKTILLEVICYFLSTIVSLKLCCKLAGKLIIFSFRQSVTAGTHRLWTHRSFKARAPLRLFLMLTNCIAAENSIYVWVRDHRVHHKHSETDADPHNSSRGFFFAHVGEMK